VKITTLETRSKVSAPPPLTDRVVGPARQVATEMWPGVPLVPVMSAGATDASFMTPVGIPTYGLSGFFSDAEGSHAHGLNERMGVKSLLDGRRYLYRLVKLYADS